MTAQRVSKLEIGGVALRALARAAGRRLRRGPTRPPWSWRAELARGAMYGILMRSKERGIPWLRAAQAAAGGPSVRQRLCTFAPAACGGVAGEWCTPPGGGAARTVVYFHGGGFVVGSVGSYREHLARLATDADARVLGVEYRLAPEHPFPAQQEDCLAATRHVLGEVPPARVVLAGDSAGGSLAVATLCALRDAGEALPAAAALLCPWVDPFAEGGSMEAHVPFDFGDRELLLGWARAALGPADPRDPRFSVIEAKLEGLPPLFVQVGGAEVLLDQVRVFAERARQAGTRVEWHEAPDMFHVWQVQAALLPEGAEAMGRVAQFLRRAVPS